MCFDRGFGKPQLPGDLPPGLGLQQKRSHLPLARGQGEGGEGVLRRLAPAQILRLPRVQVAQPRGGKQIPKAEGRQHRQRQHRQQRNEHGHDGHRLRHEIQQQLVREIQQRRPQHEGDGRDLQQPVIREIALGGGKGQNGGGPADQGDPARELQRDGIPRRAGQHGKHAHGGGSHEGQVPDVPHAALQAQQHEKQDGGDQHRGEVPVAVAPRHVRKQVPMVAVHGEIDHEIGDRPAQRPRIPLFGRLPHGEILFPEHQQADAHAQQQRDRQDIEREHVICPVRVDLPDQKRAEQDQEHPEQALRLVAGEGVAAPGGGHAAAEPREGGQGDPEARHAHWQKNIEQKARQRDGDAAENQPPEIRPPQQHYEQGAEPVGGDAKQIARQAQHPHPGAEVMPAREPQHHFERVGQRIDQARQAHGEPGGGTAVRRRDALREVSLQGTHEEASIRAGSGTQRDFFYYTIPAHRTQGAFHACKKMKEIRRFTGSLLHI